MIRAQVDFLFDIQGIAFYSKGYQLYKAPLEILHRFENRIVLLRSNKTQCVIYLNSGEVYTFNGNIPRKYESLILRESVISIVYE